MSEDTKLAIDPDQIPTKELLKRQRKEAYDEAKAQRRLEKVQAKCLAAEEKRQARSEKDKALWDLVQPAVVLSSDAE